MRGCNAGRAAMLGNCDRELVTEENVDQRSNLAGSAYNRSIGIVHILAIVICPNVLAAVY
jgi:hypothetical protein